MASIDDAFLMMSTDGGGGQQQPLAGGNGSTDDGIVNMAGSGDELTGGSGGTGTSGGAGAAPEGPSVGECVACMASDGTALHGPAQDGYEYGCQANACVTLDVNECLNKSMNATKVTECVNPSALMNVPTSTNATESVDVCLVTPARTLRAALIAWT